jgi:Mrp family chromosome partitioning ATPase
MTHTIYFTGTAGGVGTTVSAASTAVVAAHNGNETLIVDTTGTGDVFAALGCPIPTDGKIVAVGPYLSAVALDRNDHIGVTAADYDVVVVDYGRAVPDPDDGEIVTVVRNDYIALRHLVGSRPQIGTLLIVERSGRALSVVDAAMVAGRKADDPRVVVVKDDPAIARAVDAGVLGNMRNAALIRYAEALLQAVKVNA